MAQLDKILKLPDQDYLKSIIDYNPETGEAFYKTRNNIHASWNTRFAGKLICGLEGKGYIVCAIDGQKYKLHRLIWKILYGTEPIEIDHADKSKTNNKQSNLREACNSQNQFNKAVNFGKDLPKGISRSRDYFAVRVMAYGASYWGGRFSTLEEAIIARNALAEKHHKDFAG